MNTFMMSSSTDVTKEFRAMWSLRECGAWPSVSVAGAPKGYCPMLKTKEVECVYKIVDFLCRYKKYKLQDKKFTIETAREFVHNNAVKKGYSSSSIEKNWEKYKGAAPYIYAIFPLFRTYSIERGPKALA